VQMVLSFITVINQLVIYRYLILYVGLLWCTVYA